MIESSIIIPAYKEQGNITALVTRINNHLASYGKHEIIIIDDNSQDGTIELVNTLKRKHSNLNLITRIHERGLSSAVLRGFEEAKGEYLICMDADLQHPPESLMALINGLKQKEFVIGTRYAQGHLKVDKDWPLHRQIISKGARLLAYPLTALSDPMTGFFGVQRKVYLRGKPSPIGFKIAMEIFVKCNVKSHAEVPIEFGVRTAGESKLSGKVIIFYIQHLLQLYWFKYPFMVIWVIIMGLFLVYYFLALFSGL